MAIVVEANESADGQAPSKLFSAREVAELVLRKIGAFTPNDDGADSNDLDIVLSFMELEVAELAGTERCQWLVPATISLTLEVDTDEYNDLPDALGASLPSTKIAYVIAAYLVDANGAETEIDVIRRRAYESIVAKDTEGDPDRVYIDRLNDDPRLFVYPVPGASADDSTSTGLTLKLLVQTYAPTMIGAESQQTAGDLRHGLDRSWQKWLVNQTAAAVGDGPVRQLDGSKLKRLEVAANGSKASLLAYQNREKHSQHLRRTRRWGG
jgi:hypothetical protein